MYAATPPRDLDFEAALRRLRVAAFRYPSLDPAAPPGQLVEAALRGNVNLDPWDLMAVGSRVLPMRRDGWAPVLDGSSAQAWRAHLADQLAVAADQLE
jgi:hypothetical protein